MYRVIGTDDIIKEGDPHLKVKTRTLYIKEGIQVNWIDEREYSFLGNPPALSMEREITVCIGGTIEDYEIEEDLLKGNTFLQPKTKEG